MESRRCGDSMDERKALNPAVPLSFLEAVSKVIST